MRAQLAGRTKLANSHRSQPLILPAIVKIKVWFTPDNNHTVK